MKEEKISIYRVLPIVGMFLSIIIATIILFVINKKDLDEFLCAAFLIVGFVPIVVFELGYERRRGKIGNNTQTSYKRIMIGFFIGSIVMIGCTFFPEFFRPVLLLPLVLNAFSNQMIGITGALFLNTILMVAAMGNAYEILTYIMLILVGGLFAKVLKQNEYRLYISIMFMSVSILIPNIFYYLANEELVLQNLLYSFINGVLVSVFSVFCFPKTKEITEEEIIYSYERFLEDDYVQVREVRGYSWSEYRHARKVSDIAYKYANKLGYHAQLAAAAGFYYRLGRWEGEQAVENAVNKAKELCFPEELIQILSEYYGEENLPSTPESALVHMIDALLIKLELLEKEVGTSKWNREVLIYQTLNEFSSAGLYDNSGMSINAFLKVREWLAKEELL